VDGGVLSTPPSSLPLRFVGLDAGPLMMSPLPDGGYSATLSFGAVVASFEAIVGWTGGPTARRDFFVDTIPPDVQLQFNAPDSGVFLRDMRRLFVVNVNEPVSLTATLMGTGGAPVALTPLSATNAACFNAGARSADQCLLVDFAEPQFHTLTGSMTLNVMANDLAMNSTSVMLSLPVSRLRWMRSPTVVSNDHLFNVAPALDSAGNLYVASTGQLATTITPFLSYAPDGGLRFTESLGRVQGLAVGPATGVAGSSELVWITHNTGYDGQRDSDAQGRLIAHTTLGALVPGFSCALSNQPTFSAPALLDTGITVTGGTSRAAAAVMSQADSNQGAFVSLRDTGDCGGSSRAENIRQPRPNPNDGLASPLNVVASGTSAYAQVLQGRLAWATLPSAFTAPVTMTSTVVSGAAPRGLALSNSALVATQQGGPAGHGMVLFRLPLVSAAATPALEPPLPDGGTLSAAWAPTVNGGSNVQFLAALAGGPSPGPWLRSDPLHRLDAGFAGSPVPMAPITGVTTSTAPVAGNNNLVYVVSTTGDLLVYGSNQSGSITPTTPLWTTPLFPNNLVYAHPTLDCNRLEPGADRPGTLYVVNTRGTVAAVIVDSTRLNPSAPWPKWQRTAGNAGNLDYPLNPGCP
jgi:hypothetical protein